jgi:hypothetical protein
MYASMYFGMHFSSVEACVGVHVLIMHEFCASTRATHMLCVRVCVRVCAWAGLCVWFLWV